MKKLFFLATLLLIVFINAGAQALTVGDAMPDLKNLRYLKDGKYMDMEMNWNSPAMKDKLVIFDFWAPSCGPCIAGLPKMDSLQKKFGDRIMILPIVLGKEKKWVEDYIAKFWMRNAFAIKSTSLGSLVESDENKPLSEHFPAASLPYEVWVKNGKVIATTAPEYVNEKEINSILAGEIKKWVVDPGIPADLKSYDPKIPLYSYLNGNRSTNLPFVCGSLITGRLFGVRGLSTKMQLIRDSNFIRLSFLNWTIPELFRKALRPQLQATQGSLFNNRIILEVTDPSAYINFRKEYENEWSSKHLYCYQLVLPDKYSDDAAYDFATQDLNKFFGVNGRLETRKVKCWVISRNQHTPGFNERAVKQFIDERTATRAKFGHIAEALASEANESTIKGWWDDACKSISDLCARLNYQSKDCPVIDESGFTGDLAFIFRAGPSITFEDYQKQLAKIGFDLKITERPMEMMVITENGYKEAGK